MPQPNWTVVNVPQSGTNMYPLSKDQAFTARTPRDEAPASWQIHVEREIYLDGDAVERGIERLREAAEGLLDPVIDIARYSEYGDPSATIKVQGWSVELTERQAERLLTFLAAKRQSEQEQAIAKEVAERALLAELSAKYGAVTNQD